MTITEQLYVQVSVKMQSDVLSTLNAMRVYGIFQCNNGNFVSKIAASQFQYMFLDFESAPSISMVALSGKKWIIYSKSFFKRACCLQICSNNAFTALLKVIKNV